MGSDHTAFTGSVPDHYDRYLGPLLFQPYAEDIAARLRSQSPRRVLELACGTGVVTRVLRNTLPPDASLLATDLNETMIERARSKFREDEAVQWRQADATSLPFSDGSFDAVICQFGLMFFPDKQAAMNEVHRVLEPGGVFLFSVWDSIDENELSAVADQAIADFFPGDPPDFYTIPFGCHDREEIRSLCERAGFVNMETKTVIKTSVIDSATDAARGLVGGTPVAGQILQRNHAGLSAIVDFVAERIRATFGDHPVRSTMSAVVCEAHRGRG